MLVCSVFITWPKPWKVPTVVGSNVVIGVLTLCTLLHCVCNLKAIHFFLDFFAHRSLINPFNCKWIRCKQLKIFKKEKKKELICLHPDNSKYSYLTVIIIRIQSNSYKNCYVIPMIQFLQTVKGLQVFLSDTI